MEITFFGLLLMPLGIYAFFLRPNWLLPALIISSIFQGAAVFNISVGVDYGLAPYYFFAILIALRLWAGFITTGGRICVMRRWIPLALFVLAAMLGALMLPMIFQGLPVYNPRLGIDVQQGNLSLLTFNAANLSHPIYLLLNVSVLVAFCQAGDKLKYRGAEKAIHVAAVIACVIGVYQYSHFIYGLPFPFEELYSNIQVRKEMVSSLEGYKRVFSSFPEPSYFSAFITAYMFFYSSRFGFRILYNPLRVTILVSLLLMLVLTGSTTGYISFIVTGGLWVLCVSGLSFGMRLVRLSMAIVLISFIFFMAQQFSPFNSYIVETLLEKNSSLSAINRLNADMRGLDVAMETFGFGAGLGANATSSLVTMLISNCGLLGFILFSFAVMFDLTRFRIIELISIRQQQKGIGFWALTAIFVSMIAAIPYINWPILWVFWGVVLMLSAAAKSSGLSLPQCQSLRSQEYRVILNGA